jgi:hypothetical protein
MASEAIHIPHEGRFNQWFPDFFKNELAPYPGRGGLVARIVIAATLTMILIITFRIPSTRGHPSCCITAFRARYARYQMQTCAQLCA